MSGRVLLLGGTAEARALAEMLVAAPIEVVSSLAGRVARPRLPVGEVRIGGFGGVAGLVDTLAGFDLVVDATHPFATGMSGNAVRACAATGTPLLRLERPGWDPDPSWHLVDDHAEAAALVATMSSRPFLTVGRQELATFLPALAEHAVLARVVDEPELTVPPTWRILTSRGPYTLDGDRAVLREHDADALVTKNSGGEYTRPKLLAAAELNIPVVMVRRSPATDGVLLVDSVAEAFRWIQEQT